MAGYSGTPLRKKLGIKDGSSVGIIGTAPIGLESLQLAAVSLPSTY